MRSGEARGGPIAGHSGRLPFAFPFVFAFAFSFINALRLGPKEAGQTRTASGLRDHVYVSHIIYYILYITGYVTFGMWMKGSVLDLMVHFFRSSTRNVVTPPSSFHPSLLPPGAACCYQVSSGTYALHGLPTSCFRPCCHLFPATKAD